MILDLGSVFSFFGQNIRLDLTKGFIVSESPHKETWNAIPVGDVETDEVDDKSCEIENISKDSTNGDEQEMNCEQNDDNSTHVSLLDDSKRLKHGGIDDDDCTQGILMEILVEEARNLPYVKSKGNLSVICSYCFK